MQANQAKSVISARIKISASLTLRACRWKTLYSLFTDHLRSRINDETVHRYRSAPFAALRQDEVHAAPNLE